MPDKGLLTGRLRGPLIAAALRHPALGTMNFFCPAPDIHMLTGSVGVLNMPAVLTTLASLQQKRPSARVCPAGILIAIFYILFALLLRNASPLGGNEAHVVHKPMRRKCERAPSRRLKGPKIRPRHFVSILFLGSHLACLVFG